MTTARMRQLQREIEKTKARIMALGDLRPGVITQQYNVCGSPGCRCKADPPQKHGPYHQLSYTLRKKSTTRFVKTGDIARIRKETDAYAALKRWMDRWVELATQISDLKLRERQSS